MKLFRRIFLSFWIATILMIGAVLGVGEFLPINFPGDRGSIFEPALAESALAKTIDTYERQGSAAFLSQMQEPSTIRHDAIYLLDKQGNVLVKDGVAPPFYAQLAANALQTGHSEVV
ncbi:MAG: hypothetical protein WBQ94_01915, partial [Terracidiphilus sp.]